MRTRRDEYYFYHLFVIFYDNIVLIVHEYDPVN